MRHERLLPCVLAAAPFLSSARVAEGQGIVDPLFAASTSLRRPAGEGAGFVLATAGDVDGDGFSDLVLGAHLAGGLQGRAYLHRGGARPLATEPSQELSSAGEHSLFGFAVAAAGDVDGDGYGDLLVGATAQGGAVYLHRGTPAGASAQAAWSVEGLAGSALGEAVAGAGDINGDGLADVIIAAPRFGADARGAVWVHLGTNQGGAGLEVEPFWSRQGAADEAFGTAVAGAGDVNGDGLADILVGSLDSGAASRAGRAYLFLGRAGGLPQQPDWTVGGAAEEERRGSSLGRAGDVDGDGFGDFIVGAPSPSSQGRAQVFAGGAGTISTTPVWTAAAGLPGTAFGASVSTAGDANGDGRADVLVGEPLHDAGGGPSADLGRLLLFLGSSTGLSPAPDRSLAGTLERGVHGMAVAPAGDVDGDGFGDVLAGAPTLDSGEGVVTLYHGAARFPSLAPAWSVEGDVPQRGLGLGALAEAGDVNGDGFGDAIVGGYDGFGLAPEMGVVHVFLGSRDGLRAAPERTFLTEQPQYTFGLAAGSAGDVEGDGDNEIFICHSGYTAAFPGEGRVSLYSGGPQGLSERPVWVRDGGREGASFGDSAAALDANGDGYGDLVVCASGHPDAAGLRVGRAFLFQGSPAGLSLTPSWTAWGEQEGSSYGFRLISAGDVDADGYPDVVVGAFSYSGLLPLEGKAYLYRGSSSGLSGAPDWTKTTGSASSRMGSLAAGDFDGDGRSDLLVGGLFHTSFAANVGGAWLYLGTAGGLREVPAWFGEGDHAGARLAIRADGAGDLDRDGHADVVIGENGGSLTGRAFVYAGTPHGLSTAPVWTAASPQPGDRFGSPGTAGDVDGDGFPDLLVGASRHERPGADNAGKVYLHLGNGGGMPRRPRQLRTRSTRPVVHLGRSDSSDSFRLGMDARSPAGRARVRLEWEVKPVGTPFDGAGIGRGAMADTGEPIAGEGSRIELIETAGGLLPGTAHAWRARIAGSDPFFPRSPWLSLPRGGITEAKLRTAPHIPPVTSLHCETVAEMVEVRWQNGDAYDSIELRRDGGEPVVLSGNAVQYLDPAPGTGRHHYAVTGIRDAVRSPSQGAAATVRAVEELPVGADVGVVLTPDTPRAWFTVTPRRGSLLRITLGDDDPADANALYARWQAPARASAFDHAAERRAQALQQIVVPSARAQALSLLAQANVFAGSDNTIRLRVEEAQELALEDLTCRRAGAGRQAVSGIVTGAGFEISAEASTSFHLEGMGSRIESSDVILASSSRAEVVFDLSGAPPGSYDLEAVKVIPPAHGEVETFRARLANAFEITSGTRGPLLQVQVGGPRITRRGRVTPLEVRYANAGDVEMPSPLLLVTAPEGGELRLANEATFRGRRLLVLGAPDRGRADRLAPGASGVVPIVYRGTGCGACVELQDERVSCCDPIEVEELRPPRHAFVAWDVIEAPEGLEDGWEDLRRPLSGVLGGSWMELHESMAARARRLARRGGLRHSMLEPFRLAVREAAGRPQGAIAGLLRRAESGEPEAGILVVALAGGEVQAAAWTDGEGRFLLEWLAGATRYEVVAEERNAVAASQGGISAGGGVLVDVPAGEDVLGLELVLAPGESRGLAPACPGCDDAGLPLQPLFPPAELFALASRWEVGLVGSEDPNEKGGSTGPDELLARRPVIHYTVYFENKAEADAPAQSVRIIDRLDGDRLDLSTFRIGSIDLGSDSPAKLLSFHTDGYTVEARVPVLVPAALGAPGGLPGLETVEVAVQAGLDLVTGELVFALQSVTGDVFQGFLHPNDPSGRGQGSVSFSVSPRNDVAREDDIRNRAVIFFDENDAIQTNDVTIPAELFFPEHDPRRPRPAGGAAEVSTATGLCWEAVGRTEKYEVALGKEGEAPATVETVESCLAVGPLEPSTTYRWQVTAVSVSGRRSAGPMWSFTTEPPPPLAASAATNPIPPDGAADVASRPVLSWASPAPGARSFALRLWRDGDPRPASPLVTGWSAASLPLPRLECGRAYRWQVVSSSSPLVEPTPGPEWRFTVRGHAFRRGDVDASGGLDITDAISALGYLFTGGAVPSCLEAADADGSGFVDITDPIAILGYLFLGRPPPAHPFAACGCGDEESTLGCGTFAACP